MPTSEWKFKGVSFATELLMVVFLSVNDQRDSKKHPIVSWVVVRDWMISIAVICFHPHRQNRGQGIDAKLILTGKEILRRLFAFYRSSLLEVCRIFSRQWGTKEFRNVNHSNRDSEYSIFPADCGSFIGKAQFPRRYLLRVSIASVSIARERSEIDGPRLECFSLFLESPN